MNASTFEGDISARARDIRRLADASAPERRKWLARAAFFHQEDLRYLKFLIPEGARVLELGCGTGDLLAALKPSFGVGVDFSAGMIAQARHAHPDLTFLVGDIEDAAFVRSLPGPFDVIVVVDTLGALASARRRVSRLRADMSPSPPYVLASIPTGIRDSASICSNYNLAQMFGRDAFQSAAASGRLTLSSGLRSAATP